MTAKAARRSDAGQFHIAHLRPGHLVAFHLGFRVAQILAKHPAPDRADTFQKHLRHLRYHDPPRLALRLACVDGDDLEARRVQIRAEVENGTVVVDEGVARIVVIQQFHHRPVADDLLVKHPVLWLRAQPHLDDEILAVFRHMTAKTPLRLILAFIDDRVLALRRAELVEAKLVKLILRRQSRAGLWLVVARVKEAAAVLQPGHTAEFHPLHHIVQIMACGDVTHADRRPVTPGFRNAVGDEFATLAWFVVRQRSRAIRRHRVRVQQHSSFTLQRLCSE